MARTLLYREPSAHTQGLFSLLAALSTGPAAELPGTALCLVTGLIAIVLMGSIKFTRFRSAAQALLIGEYVEAPSKQHP